MLAQKDKWKLLAAGIKAATSGKKLRVYLIEVEGESPTDADAAVASLEQ